MEKEIFLGDKGTKGEFFLKLENVIKKPDYMVHKLVDRKGRKAMFYNYRGDTFGLGDCILVKATVADHRSYKDEPFSYLNRVTVIENKGSKKNQKHLVLLLGGGRILQRRRMKKAVIEILYDGEAVLGSRTAGKYMVREYEDDLEMGGGFFKTIEEAEARVNEYQNEME